MNCNCDDRAGVGSRIAPSIAQGFSGKTRMPERSEERLILRQADQARGDLYAIRDELEFIRDRLARQPTRMEMLHLMLGGSALTVALIELFRVL